MLSKLSRAFLIGLHLCRVMHAISMCGKLKSLNLTVASGGECLISLHCLPASLTSLYLQNVEVAASSSILPDLDILSMSGMSGLGTRDFEKVWHISFSVFKTRNFPIGHFLSCAVKPQMLVHAQDQ